jgi:hypothetical protein
VKKISTNFVVIDGKSKSKRGSIPRIVDDGEGDAPLSPESWFISNPATKLTVFRLPLWY